MPLERPLRPTVEEAATAWRAAVEANREQIERLREESGGGDFWAGRAASFKPRAEAAPAELPELVALARPTDAWLDIGAGGGRYGVPMSPHVREWLAVEPSPAMRATFEQAAAEAGRENVRWFDGRWPDEAGRVPMADVSLTAHVLYDQDDIGAFLEAMESRTRRTCAVIIGDRAPSGGFEPLWTQLHGEPAALLPALPELLAVLGALGRRFDVRTYPLSGATPVPLDDAHAAARRLYWVREGSEKDARLRDLLVRHYGRPDGLVAPPARLRWTALVTWPPPGAGSGGG